MRMTKKITSIVLAVLMVVSMMSVMAVTSASAYDSITEVYNAMQEGGTITLDKDFTYGGSLSVPAGKTVTLDLAGHTLKSKNNSAICNEGTLTIKDSVGGGQIIAQEACVLAPGSGAKTTINGGTYTSKDNGVFMANGNNGNSGNKWTISAGTFNGYIQTAGYVACGIYAANDDTWTIYGGTFNIYNGVAIVQRAGKVTVKGGTFNVTGDGTQGKVGDSRVVLPSGTGIVYDSKAKYPGQTETSKTTVTGGTFTTTQSPVTQVKASSDNTRITVSAGTFDKEVDAAYIDASYKYDEATDKIVAKTDLTAVWEWIASTSASYQYEAKLTLKDGDTVVLEKVCSPEINVVDDDFNYTASATNAGIKYTAPDKFVEANGVIKTSNELKSAAKTAASWELGNDLNNVVSITVSNGFKLDGKGYTINANTTYSPANYQFVVKDENTTFEISNVTLDGGGERYGAVSTFKSGKGGVNQGTVVTLNNVTIQNYKSSNYTGAVYAFGSSTVNLNNCTVTGNKNNTNAQKVNGKQVSADEAAAASGKDIWAGSTAHININGGTYGEVFLHSNSGTGATLDSQSATIDTVRLDMTKTDTLKANIASGTVNNIEANGDIPEEIVVIDPDDATVAAPAGYKWNDSEETGKKTLAPIEYVAQVGDVKYETVAAAIDAAQAGDTVKLLKDVTGPVTVTSGKDITLDLNGKTISGGSYGIVNNGTLTVEGSGTVSGTYGVRANANSSTTINGGTFNAQECAVATFKNTSNATITINDGTFTTVDNSVLSGNGSTASGGNTWNINGGTFNGNITTPGYIACGIYAPNDDTWNVNGGTFNVTNGAGIVQRGGKVIVGDDVVIKTTGTATGKVGDAATQIPCAALVYDDANYPGQTESSAMTVKGGNFESEVDAIYFTTSGYSIIKVSGGTFSSRVPNVACATSFVPTDADEQGKYTVEIIDDPLDPFMTKANIAQTWDNNQFNISNDYHKGTLLGVQKKNAIADAAKTSASGQETGKDIRFVAVLDTQLLKAADDYGFVLAKVGTDKDTTNTNFDNLKANWGNGEKTVSAKGTYNNVCGSEVYGNPTDSSTNYKYITCAVNGLDTESKVVAKFYVTIGGKTYYAQYAAHDYQYRGVTAGINAVGAVY